MALLRERVLLFHYTVGCPYIKKIQKYLIDACRLAASGARVQSRARPPPMILEDSDAAAG
jgi:hypothetical protein